MTEKILREIYYNAIYPGQPSFEYTANFSNLIKGVTDPIITIIKKTSSWSLIPDAYAQGCGSEACGGSTMIQGVCQPFSLTVCTGGTDSYGVCIPGGTTTYSNGGGNSCGSAADCKYGGIGQVCPPYTLGCHLGASQSCNSFGTGLACRNPCLHMYCNSGACVIPACTFGAWSACTFTCGGGTQTRSDNCGNTQTQSCNTQSCCGNGVCAGGETCSTCSTDCGACAPPPGPFCGDNSCNNGETCSSCAHDCGACAQSCTPSCTTACGQADGCGGTCSNASVGTPAIPTGLNPPDGTGVISSNGTVSVNWDVMPLANLYQVEVYPTGTTPGQECTALHTHCPGNQASNSYTFAADVGVAGYTWTVRAINTSCGSTLNSAFTTPISFTVGGSFAGNYYSDDAGTAVLNPATGLCESGTATTTTPPGGTSISATWNGNTTAGVLSSYFYNINNIGSDPNTVVSTTLPLGYRCSCPAGCSYSGLSVPLSNVNFYITTNPLGWWQSSNGYVYAAATSGTAIQSEIPATCTGACIAAISKYDSANTLTSDSTSLSGGGAIDSTADTTTTYSFLNQGGTDTHAQGMILNGPREDYTYFSQLFGITTANTVDFTGNQPVSPPSNGSAYYANTDTSINNPWTVDTATSIVVFVNGNLTITKPILVAKGGFVAFIVKGNITFDKTLGSNSATTPSAEGVFIANGQIITQSAQPADDLKFIGDGTFVGWTGISLQRNFNNANVARGNTEPIETFNYRPDFLLSVPIKMTKPLFLWQEVN